MAGRVLIIDDEPNVRKTMEMIHRNAGWRTASAESGAEAIEILGQESFDLVYLDLAMPDRGGIDVLKDIKLRLPDQTVVILTGQASVEKAVEATKLGAFDFLEKDCSKERILLTSKNALEHGALDRENRLLRGKVAGRQEFLGKSKDHEETLRQIDKVAPTDARVLIVGESGTGKELIAQEIHKRSKRAGKPFIKVNCAAIPEELIEAELFGSVKGAFTGSVASREGKFQAADGGTILLDEVGDMSLRVQTKVLRAIQEGEIERVGSDGTITVDVRVLAATNKNLEEEIAAGRFREDLYFRLNVVPIAAKPLREHPEDVGFLAGAFMKSYCTENGLPEKRLDDRVLDLLKRYRWPGNVRELRNQVERLIIMSPGRTVHVEDLSREIRSGVAATPGEGPARTEEGQGPETRQMPSHESEIGNGSLPLQEARREFERRMILNSLERNDWNVTRAAGELGLERTALHKKIKTLGLEKGGV
ncbi:MAG: sigma-54 dependent transcriptional regulator [Candidatus Eisenbacteria bacterium]